MRRCTTVLLVSALAAMSAACGQGPDVGAAAGRVGVAGDEPSNQKPSPVVAPTGGFGPLQVTPRTEAARPVSRPATAGSAGGDCWDSPGLTEYTLAVPGGKPGWVAAADDGAVWFSDQGDTSIGRLEPSGAVTRYPLPAGRTPGSITVAADGTVWFVTTGPAVAHLTRSGELVGYAVPPVPTPKWGTTDSEPTSLTTGPDGAVWYVNMGGDAVGRVDAAGHVSHYPLPSTERMHVNPEGIAAGADGAMWVSETLAMRMARVDVHTFNITEHPVPSVPTGVPPAGVTAGPDGALWFDGPALGRMTTGGDFGAYQLPWQGQYAPTSATAGPDRRIWTVDTRNGKVLRTTLDGQTSEAPPVADPKALYDGGLRELTGGPDAVWVAEAALNRIGRYACGTSRPGVV